MSVKIPTPNSAASAACAAFRCVAIERVVCGGPGGVVVVPEHAESTNEATQTNAQIRLF
jgi:hypothetical protein